jgi:dolichol-phosphate mannosyltransferase
MSMMDGRTDLEVSVVVPVRNEADNIAPLIGEIVTALFAYDFEIIYVDDGSSDETLSHLRAVMVRENRLRVFHHTSSCGQSRAIRTGALAAQGRIVVTLDGDGQNNPADMPALIAHLMEEGPHGLSMAHGVRRKRRDSFLRRLSSKVGNGVRGWLLQDEAPDSGCGLKAIWREHFLRLPYFDHMHRFMPALVRREGGKVEFMAVDHRPRTKGQSKYGISNRLWVGIVDLLGVMWLCRRASKPAFIREEQL